MGFVLLCVLPMCAIFAAAAWLRSDTNKAIQERELSARLGLAVTFDRVLLTQPEGLRYEGIVLADPETATEIARAASLSIVQNDGKVFVNLITPELNASRFDCLEDLVMRQLRLGKPGQRILAVTPKLTLHMPSKTKTVIDDVSVQFDFSKKSAQAVVQYQPGDREGRDRIALGVMRDREKTPPVTHVEIDTYSSALPCALLAPFCPTLERLGPACKFRGSLQVFQSPRGWSGELRGLFSNVNLATLVAHEYPGQLDGTAQLTISAAKIVAGRIEQVHGELVCGDGYIRHELADAMVRKFMLAAPQKMVTFGASHPFSELAFGFAVDSEGLLISGRCGQPGAVLVDKFGVAIHEPTPAGRLPLATVEDAFAESRATLISVLPLQNDSRLRR